MGPRPMVGKQSRRVVVALEWDCRREIGLLRRLYWIATQLGFDPLALARAIGNLPRYLGEWRRFRQMYGGELVVKPCLHDYQDEGGSTRNEYFWQDLLIAQKIFSRNPSRHVDIGSRVDGFVAHVASFRTIELLDIRPITSEIPGVKFTRADLMNRPTALAEYCDSLSCLHALEHFGLGRYGDPLDVKGAELGIENMSHMLQPGGVLYLSTPIGRSRVEFNANWVFDPNRIVAAAVGSGLRLMSLDVFQKGAVRQVRDIPSELPLLAAADYALGMFVFEKAPS